MENSKIENKYKIINGYYVKFGGISLHQTNMMASIEILDWVKISNNAPNDIYEALNISKDSVVTMNNVDLINIGYPQLSLFEIAQETTEYNFYDKISNYIILYSLRRQKDPTWFIFHCDMKLTDERKALIRTFTVPVTIVQNII